MEQTSYLTTREHRGRSRLWIEGRRLVNAGFERGASYRIEAQPDRGALRLVRDDERGDRVVSGRKRQVNGEVKPIIEVLDSEVLPKDARVRAVVAVGEITVTIHHEQTAQVQRERDVRRLVERGEAVREGALCAGIGASTQAIHEGLADAGVASQVRWIVEMETRYAELAVRNASAIRDDARLFVARIEEVEPELLDPVDVLSMSLPCDGHSIAGKSKLNLDHAEQHPTSATAVIGALELMRAANPAVVISENVVQARDSATYAILLGELARRGYCLYEAELDEQQAGTLEARRRWIFVAVSAGLDQAGFDLAEALPSYPRRYHRLGEALDEVPDDSSRWANNQYLRDKQDRDRAAGKGFANRQFVDADSDRVGTIGRGYQKRRSTEPFVLHPVTGKERLLTPPEHARVKGVPEDLIAGASETEAHEGLGQSGLYGHFRGTGHAVGALLRAQQPPSGADEWVVASQLASRANAAPVDAPPPAEVSDDDADSTDDLKPGDPGEDLFDFEPSM